MNKVMTRSVMPILYVDSIEELREFYVEKLGFQHMMGMLGKDGKLEFCTVTLDGANVMFTRPEEAIEGTAPMPGTRPIEIYLEVADVDAYHDEVAGRGVRITTPLTDQWWGDRTFRVVDPYGYPVWFYESVGEVEPPPGAKLV